LIQLHKLDSTCSTVDVVLTEIPGIAQLFSLCASDLYGWVDVSIIFMYWPCLLLLLRFSLLQAFLAGKLLKAMHAESAT
jgi:hypothetical protein